MTSRNFLDSHFLHPNPHPNADALKSLPCHHCTDKPYAWRSLPILQTNRIQQDKKLFLKPFDYMHSHTFCDSFHGDSRARYNLGEPIPLQIEHVAVEIVVEPSARLDIVFEL